MTNRHHKAYTIAVGCLILLSILMRTDLFTLVYYNKVFKLYSDMGLNLIAYPVAFVPFFFVAGAFGLISYHYWGFYATYAAYLVGLVTGFLPLTPEPIFKIIPQSLHGAVAIAVVFSLLTFTIYLHRTAKKQAYIQQKK